MALEGVTELGMLQTTREEAALLVRSRRPQPRTGRALGFQAHPGWLRWCHPPSHLVDPKLMPLGLVLRPATAGRGRCP